MARLHTSGFETQLTTSGEGDAGNIAQVIGAGAVAITTSVVRSGAAALEADQGAANWISVDVPGMVTDRAYFARGYFRFSDASPALATVIMRFQQGATAAMAQVKLNPTGALTLEVAGPVQVGSPSAVLADNTWYRVELKVIVPAVGNGTAELLLDGTTVASSSSAGTGNSVASPVLAIGVRGAGTAGVKTYVDDVALNDDQGADQNSYPGAGKVIHLLPTADSAIGNWEGPQTTGSDTTNLYDNVNDAPPTGVAHSDVDANAGRYVFNVVSAANQNFDVACQTYTAGGVGASDPIALVQALARMSVNTTSGTNTGAVAGVSNPAIAAKTGINLETAGIAATEPSGWKTGRTLPSYSPSVTLGTSPVVRATKEVANVNPAMVDYMGLLVEYAPPDPAPIVPAAAAISFAGTASVTAPSKLAPTAGAATFTASASVTAPPKLAPVAGPATFTGAATLTAPTRVVPAAAAVTFAGTATVQVVTRVVPAAGAIIFGGSAVVTSPGVAFIYPSAGAIAFTGSSTVTVVTRISPAAGAATFAGSVSAIRTIPYVQASAAVTFAGAAVVTRPGVAFIEPAGGAVTFAATALVKTPIQLPIAPAAATFGGAMSVGTPVALPLSPAAIEFAGTAGVGVPVFLDSLEAFVDFGGLMELTHGPSVPDGVVVHRPASSLAIELLRDPGAAGFVEINDSEIRFPDSVTNIGFGSEAWSNPTNAAASDALYATAELGYTDTSSETVLHQTGFQRPWGGFSGGPSGVQYVWSVVHGAFVEGDGLTAVTGGAFTYMGTSDYLILDHFFFDLPVGAVPTGVQVGFNAYSDNAFGSSGTSDHAIQLATYLGAANDNKAAGGWSTELHTRSYGGPDDRWGYGDSLTREGVMDPGFGVGIRVDQSSLSPARIDACWINVWYYVTTVTSVNIQQTSYYLTGTDFGFAIPETAEVRGISATARRKASVDYGEASVQDHTVKLLKAGTAVGSNKALTATHWPTAPANRNYGGPTDKWGTDWTPAQVNASNFGIVLAAKGMFTASVDFIRLAVTYRLEGAELEFVGAPTLKFNPDESTPGRIAVSGEFKTESPGGYSAATCAVPRPEFFDPYDYMYANCRFYEHETDTTWYEGRVVGVSDSGTEVGFEMEGWANHLNDDGTARWIPYDRDLSAWTPASVQRRLETASSRYDDPTTVGDPSTSEPALLLQLSGPDEEWPALIVSDAWYDGRGLAIAQLDFAWKKNGNVDPLGVDAFWSWRVALSDDDLYSTIDESPEQRSAGPGSGTVFTTGAAKFHARAWLTYAGGPGVETESLEYQVYFTLLGVVGDHGLPLQGSVVAPAGGRGLLVSDMVGYILEQWCPLLVPRDIETTTFALSHSVFKEPTPPHGQIESLVLFGGNSFLPLDWYVWEGRHFDLASPENYGSTWRTSYDEGAEASGQGPDAQRMINGIRVEYDDGTGTKRSVGPPGSNSDLETASLVDISDTLPCNRDGARHWLAVDAGIMNQEGAEMIGRVIMTDRNRQEWRGSITIRKWIRDSAASIRAAAEVHAGDYIIIEDDDDIRPRRIVDTGWNDKGELTLSIGAPPDRLDTVLARLGVVLLGTIGGELQQALPQ